MLFDKEQSFDGEFYKKSGSAAFRMTHSTPDFSYIFLSLSVINPPAMPMHTPATMPEIISAGR